MITTVLSAGAALQETRNNNCRCENEMEDTLANFHSLQTHVSGSVFSMYVCTTHTHTYIHMHMHVLNMNGSFYAADVLFKCVFNYRFLNTVYFCCFVLFFLVYCIGVHITFYSRTNNTKQKEMCTLILFAFHIHFTVIPY